MAPPRGVPNAVRPQPPGSPNPDGPNHVEIVGTSDTGQQMQNEAETQYGVDFEDDSMWAQLMDMFNGDREKAEAYLREQTNSQANVLAQGLQTREGPMMQCANYMAFDHQSLDGMVKQNADPGAVGSTGDAWIRAGNAMAEFQGGVVGAINNSSADWQGKSGDMARGFMADVGNWVGEAGQSAQLAGTQMNVQAQALSKAKNDMPPEVPYDQGEWIQKIFASSDPWGTWEEAKAQYKAHQEAHQDAAHVVATYDAGLAGASTMPAFTAPPTMAGGGVEPPKLPPDRVGPFPPDGGGPGPGGGPGGGSGSLTPPGAGGIGTRPPTLPGGPGGPGSPGGPGGPGGGLPGGPGYPGGTLPGGAQPWRPGGQGGSGGGSGGGPGGEGGLGGIPIGGMPGGGFPGGGDSDRGPGGRGGGTGPGGRGFGPGGSGPGGTGFGTGGESGRSGALGRGPGAGGMGPGGAGALAAEHAAGGGGGRGLGAGGRGGAGGMPMGGMGGGRGQGDEDGEHQRPSYLVEGDPESVFGTDEMTAPPVIGE